MACVTIKRPLDFDPLEALHSPNRPPTKRRRCTPIKSLERDELGGFASASSKSKAGAVPSMPSVFREASSFSAEEIANNLRDEMKRMKRRRLLASSIAPSGSTDMIAPTSPCSSGPSSPEPMMDSVDVKSSSPLQNQQRSSVGGVQSAGSSTSSNSSPHMPSVKSLVGTREKPVFTLKQMTLICERMCKERTEQVRQEYDKILQQKLSEQYDAFVKFIDHQIQQRFNQSQLPSYLS